MNVLIVEDDEAIANLIKINMTAEGYHCTCAYDGKSGADYIEKESFDLILLDIMLPEINVGVFSFRKFVGKFYTDLMSFLVRYFSGHKSLYQMKCFVWVCLIRF